LGADWGYFSKGKTRYVYRRLSMIPEKEIFTQLKPGTKVVLTNYYMDFFNDERRYIQDRPIFNYFTIVELRYHNIWTFEELPGRCFPCDWIEKVFDKQKQEVIIGDLV
jgi:hypothetical protein